MEVKATDAAAQTMLTKILYKLGLSSALDPDDLANMVAAFSLEVYKSGEAICSKGEIGKAFYIIYKGKASVAGRKFGLVPSTVAVLGPGDSFGEMAILKTIIRTTTVKAQGESEIFALHSTRFKDLFEKNPTFKNNLEKLARSRGLEIESKGNKGLA